MRGRRKGLYFAATLALSFTLIAGAGVKEMEFVRIPPGQFVMGCSVGDVQCDDNEKPAHSVRITKGFELGKYEVTQEQWQAVMGNNPSDLEGANLPVEQVSWNNVQEFLQKMNAKQDGYRYRLPTEAEWEYAARAGTTGPNAGPEGTLDAMAWYNRNSNGDTHPGGLKQANAWGLYDMQGDVWEWVEDWYGEKYYSASPASDPAGPSTGTLRVVRGGGWDDNAKLARVSERVAAKPGYGNTDLGFRCLRERAQY